MIGIGIFVYPRLPEIRGPFFFFFSEGVGVWGVRWRLGMDQGSVSAAFYISWMLSGERDTVDILAIDCLWGSWSQQ